MLDHSGTLRVRYEDVFRAIGNYLDENQFSLIVIAETPEGFLIKGEMVTGTLRADTFRSQSMTYLFSNDDIDALIENAYQRREKRS